MIFTEKIYKIFSTSRLELHIYRFIIQCTQDKAQTYLSGITRNSYRTGFNDLYPKV